MRLVLPGQQDVALAALGEAGGGAARAGVEHGDVAVEPAEILLRRPVVAAGLAQRPGPGGQVVPAGAAGGLRVRRDDGDAGLRQVAPVADALRIPLPHQEDDGAGIGRAVVRQPSHPVARDQPALGDGVDVVGQRERDDIGRQPIDDRARLPAGPAMRGADAQRLAGAGLPGSGEGGIVLAVEFARRVIADIQQLARRLARAAAAGSSGAASRARRVGARDGRDIDAASSAPEPIMTFEIGELLKTRSVDDLRPSLRLRSVD